MNPATVMAVAMAGVTFALGVLFLGLSRAHGWAMLRWFAVASLTSSVYCAMDFLFSLPGVSDTVIVWAARVAGGVAALQLTAWILFARGREERPLGRVDRIAVGAALLLAAAHMVPGLIYTSEILVHEVPWLGVTYSFPRATVLGFPAYLLILGILTTAMVALWRMSSEVGLKGGVLRGAILLFLLTAANEVLVATHLVATPFLLELGFTGVIVAVGIEITTKFLDDARSLGELSERLDGQVKERTAQLERTQADLEKSERLAAVGRLAAGVGHEINNPLSYVLLNLHTLRDGIGDAEQRELADEALDGVERIRSIVTDLRVLARTEVDEANVADLGHVLADAAKLVGPCVPYGARLDVTTERLPLVRGNPHRLTQVFTNLLGNALESTDGVGEGLHVSTACRIEEGTAEVEVIDSGPGIPAELLDRIFEPFFSKKRGGGGTGLGLPICRAIVEANDGRIEVRSDGGSGTTVVVTLRLASRSSGAPSPPPSREEPSPPPSRAEPSVEDRCLRVLVVDDEALVARAMCRALAGHEVVTALSGRDGLALLVDRGQDFDVVICDVMLPDVSGAEVHDRAVEARPELSRRFFFVTGGAVDDQASAFLGREGVRWLSKPVYPEVLQQEVARVASERQAESRGLATTRSLEVLVFSRPSS